MVRSGQVWTHYISLNETDEPELACIVATTRNSDDVAFITKVYTAEKWRRRGCAERLVRLVCKQCVSKKPLSTL
jgi:predicted GNAT family acetyltransferase